MNISENSIGAILVKTSDSKVEFLLLKYINGHWDFPKGNVETGESEYDTARREIIEETGIRDIEFLDGFKEDIYYSYKREGKIINKKVIFFLAKTKFNNVILSSEHTDYIWTTYAEAKKIITYKNSMMLLDNAYNFLNSHNIDC